MRADVGRWAVMLALGIATAARGADGPGARVFAERCSACHGDNGAGDGPIASAVSPPPRNFREAAFWSGRTDTQLREVVVKGRAGTLMGAFEGVLTPEEIDAVVTHLRTFAPAAASARPGDGQVPDAGRREDPAGSRPRP